MSYKIILTVQDAPELIIRYTLEKKRGLTLLGAIVHIRDVLGLSAALS